MQDATQVLVLTCGIDAGSNEEKSQPGRVTVWDDGGRLAG